MNTNTSVTQPNQKSEITSAILKRLIQVGALVLIQAAILFISSGHLDWVMAWVYLGIYLGMIGITAVLILPKNPDLIAERGQLGEGAKTWDKLLSSTVGTLGPLAVLIVAGLDIRFAWSRMPLVVQLLAVGFFTLGLGIFVWAMSTNKFFSSLVRIQKDRGHTVVTTGPYHYVRHPGYIVQIISLVATPLLLGSLWALIPVGLTVCFIVIRTALEDKTLLAELDGYTEYANKVHYRLLPGVW